MQSFFSNLECLGNSVLGLNAFLYLFAQIAQIILGVTGSLALLMFVIGGFMWLISTGNQKMIEMGRATLINALIGLLVILGSWLLIDFIMTQFTTRGSAWHTFGGKLCEEGRDIDLGATTTAPVAAVSSTPPQNITHAGAKTTVPCKYTVQSATLACKQCDSKYGSGSGKVSTIGCATGKAQCECTDAKGRTCADEYNTATNLSAQAASRCDIQCGSSSISLAEQGPNTAPGGTYYCCKCIPKTLIPGLKTTCGVNAAGFKAEKKNEACIVSWHGVDYVKCDKGGDPLPTTPDGKTYCSIKKEGALCIWTSRHQKGGCVDGSECIIPLELEEKDLTPKQKNDWLSKVSLWGNDLQIETTSKLEQAVHGGWLEGSCHK